VENEIVADSENEIVADSMDIEMVEDSMDEQGEEDLEIVEDSMDEQDDEEHLEIDLNIPADNGLDLNKFPDSEDDSSDEKEHKEEIRKMRRNAFVFFLPLYILSMCLCSRSMQSKDL
jgi:hypothetical protein